MAPQALDKILIQYRERLETYSALAKKVAKAVSQLLADDGLAVHAVRSRVKQRSRLRMKLESPGNKYRELSEITDIAGVRVITYFHDQVERVSDLVQRAFLIDAENSVDKGELLDPDRFGYLSRHYVIQLDPEKLTKGERRIFEGIKCEIQVRSILQHAWAEIEHDLGYKTKEAVPREIRRSFSRLAGLLEIADVEFARIRNRLEVLTEDINSKIEAGSPGLAIDKLSLWGLVRQSRIVTHWDEEIRKTVGASAILDLDAIEQWIPIMRAAGCETIDALERAVQRHGPILPVFSREFRRSMGRYDDSLPIARGLSVIRAVDAELATSGLDDLRRAYAASGRQVTDDYTDRLVMAFNKATEAAAE